MEALYNAIEDDGGWSGLKLPFCFMTYFPSFLEKSGFLCCKKAKCVAKIGIIRLLQRKMSCVYAITLYSKLDNGYC